MAATHEGEHWAATLRRQSVTASRAINPKRLCVRVSVSLFDLCVFLTGVGGCVGGYVNGWGEVGRRGHSTRESI